MLGVISNCILLEEAKLIYWLTQRKLINQGSKYARWDSHKAHESKTTSIGITYIKRYKVTTLQERCIYKTRDILP
jgi:hypothetical protein